jgi:hypothetical protein
MSGEQRRKELIPVTIFPPDYPLSVSILYAILYDIEKERVREWKA